jgi:hypothetical protein
MAIITLLSAKSDWWGGLNSKQRQVYVEKHPRSKYKARGLVPPTEHTPYKPKAKIKRKTLTHR